MSDRKLSALYWSVAISAMTAAGVTGAVIGGPSKESWGKAIGHIADIHDRLLAVEAKVDAVESSLDAVVTIGKAYSGDILRASDTMADAQRTEAALWDALYDLQREVEMVKRHSVPWDYFEEAMEKVGK